MIIVARRRALAMMSLPSSRSFCSFYTSAYDTGSSPARKIRINLMRSGSVSPLLSLSRRFSSNKRRSSVLADTLGRVSVIECPSDGRQKVSASLVICCVKEYAIRSTKAFLDLLASRVDTVYGSVTTAFGLLLAILA